jgi:protein-tyrosine-phosphatase
LRLIGIKIPQLSYLLRRAEAGAILEFLQRWSTNTDYHHALRKMITVLLLCTTNFIRTPLLEALLTKVATEDGLAGRIRFKSGGTYAGQISRGVDRRIQTHALALGLDLSAHLSRQIALADCHEANNVICLDEDSFGFVRREIPDFPQHRIKLATEYGDNLGVREVAEPASGQGSFEAVVELSLKLAPMILEKLRKEHGL